MTELPPEWVVDLIVFLGLVVAAALLCFGGLPTGSGDGAGPDNAQEPQRPVPPLM